MLIPLQYLYYNTYIYCITKFYWRKNTKASVIDCCRVNSYFIDILVSADISKKNKHLLMTYVSKMHTQLFMYTYIIVIVTHAYTLLNRNYT